MRANVRALARGAVLTALATVLIYLGGVLPTWRLAITAIAGLAALAAMLLSGEKWAAAVFVLSALLSLLLAPVKVCAILYAVFLGYYPALKCLIERLRAKPLQWGVKLILLNVVLVCLYFLARSVLLDSISVPALPVWILWIGVNVVFVVYDYGLTGLIRVFIRRIAGKGVG